MIDIKFLRENPEAVKENIRKKFQDQKLGLVDEVIALDAEVRAAQQEADDIRAKRNKISKEIGALMGQGKKEEAEAKKAEVAANAKRLAELEEKENELREKIKKDMMTIPNIIDPSVPLGKDDTENVEIQKYGEPVVPDFEIPYHTEIMERFHGIDMDAAGRVAGNGFYYLITFCSNRVCERFYDWPGIYLLCAAFHDQKRCGRWCYEFCRNGCHDV